MKTEAEIKQRIEELEEDIRMAVPTGTKIRFFATQIAALKWVLGDFEHGYTKTVDVKGRHIE